MAATSTAADGANSAGDCSIAGVDGALCTVKSVADVGVFAAGGETSWAFAEDAVGEDLIDKFRTGGDWPGPSAGLLTEETTIDWVETGAVAARLGFDAKFGAGAAGAVLIGSARPWPKLAAEVSSAGAPGEGVRTKGGAITASTGALAVEGGLAGG